MCLNGSIRPLLDCRDLQGGFVLTNLRIVVVPALEGVVYQISSNIIVGAFTGPYRFADSRLWGTTIVFRQKELS